MQSLSGICSADILNQNNLIILEKSFVALGTSATWQCILSAGESNGVWCVSPWYLLLLQERKDFVRQEKKEEKKST